MLAARRKRRAPGADVRGLVVVLFQRRSLYILAALALVLLIAIPTLAPGNPSTPPQQQTEPTETPAPAPTPTKTFAGPPPMSLAPDATYSASIQTPRGSIKVDLYPDAPSAVNNFVYLSKQAYYNGLSIYSVAPGQRVEAGSLNDDGTGGPGYTVPPEPNKHPEDFASVVALPEPDGNLGSRFAIALATQIPPSGSIVMGRVTDGMDVVRQLRQGDRISGIRITEPSQ